MKTLIYLFIIALFSLSYANYIIKFQTPDPKAIKFVEKTSVAPEENEIWNSIEPIITEWTNIGETYDCINWNPDAATVPLGTFFEQTATDCKQDQTRTLQNREQEVTSLQIRNIGTPVIENQTLSDQTKTREIEGTMPVEYNYYRIYIQSPVSGDYSQIGELELLNENGQDLFDLYTVEVSESSFHTAVFAGDKTIDNLLGNKKWTSKFGLHINSWVAYNFPVPVSPKTLTLSSAAETARQPKNFSIQYSSDGVNWTTMKSFSGISSWSSSEKKTFSLE